ncbi:tRNA preQ1(34) S-adenosylmethionine ribosyltransferase-isomerase QueA [Planctomicrobium sp. SH664]|uniref:tRNA preQ1(34) S-adenosylmethionine ribosyltransferase-isomerase QueA n=1 Tax=Planctomicrobium sp. SH664 TaxID=3448125 RepID=UPI003F5C9D4F
MRLETSRSTGTVVLPSPERIDPQFLPVAARGFRNIGPSAWDLRVAGTERMKCFNIHPMDDRTDLYDFILPPELIAQTPAEQRDASRLLVIQRDQQAIRHLRFQDLPELLSPGDLLVMNDTRVVPARLVGLRTSTGGKWEGLFLREEASGLWRLMGRTRGRLNVGETITLHPADPSKETGELLLQLESKGSGGEWLCRPLSDLPTFTLLDEFGAIPLPPYMHREAGAADSLRYQTTYAARPGAVAAPTAGLHFTPEILQRCADRGIETARVTLHVGLGTFRPVSVDRLGEHEMHSEWCELPESTARALEQCRQRGGRVVAIGTTSVRTLESRAQSGTGLAGSGETRLFIRPPYQFQLVDALLTNFHLPRSTLLVLVSTFAGRELILRAYAEAIRERYRFYSYGDAMLIL